MDEWSHSQLENLLDEVQGLENFDPDAIDHPSNAELDAYVQGELSPFLRQSIEQHIERCPRCVDYLAEAFERDAASSAPAAAEVVSFDRARRSAGATWWRAAAVWVLALPVGVWLSSHFLAPPVVIETRGDAVQAVASPGENRNDRENRRPVLTGDWVTQAQFEQAMTLMTQAVSEVRVDQMDDPDGVSERLAALSEAETRRMFEPLLEEFVALASDRMAQEMYPELKDRMTEALNAALSDAGNGGPDLASDTVDSTEERPSSKRQFFMTR